MMQYFNPEKSYCVRSSFIRYLNIVGGAQKVVTPIFRKHIAAFLSARTCRNHKQYRRTAYPLAVNLAPGGFCPARIGHCKMQPVRPDILPVLRGQYMPERIRKIMPHHFRHGRGARGEIQQEYVAVFCSFGARTACEKPGSRLSSPLIY